MSVDSYLKNQSCHESTDDIINNVKMTWFQQLMSIFQSCPVIEKYTKSFAVFLYHGFFLWCVGTKTNFFMTGRRLQSWKKKAS